MLLCGIFDEVFKENTVSTYIDVFPWVCDTVPHFNFQLLGKSFRIKPYGGLETFVVFDNGLPK